MLFLLVILIILRMAAVYAHVRRTTRKRTVLLLNHLIKEVKTLQIVVPTGIGRPLRPLLLLGITL